MGASQSTSGVRRKPGLEFSTSLIGRLLIIVLFDAFAVWFGINQLNNGAVFLVVALGVVTLFVNIVLLLRDTYPLRWMLPGLVLMAFFSIYPNLFTVYVAFTNFGDGHLVSKEQAITQLSEQLYLPEGGAAYSWTAYQSDDGQYALWLVDPDGNGFLAREGEPLIQAQPGEAGVGEFDTNGIPGTIAGYQRLNTLLAATDENLPNILFGEASATIQIRSPGEAAQLQSLFIYDPERDVMINQETGKEFAPIEGTFTAQDGEALIPGFQANIGFKNFTDFLTSPALPRPLIDINLEFRFSADQRSLDLFLGLMIAILYNDPSFPGRKLIRSLLLIPYTIPSLITILIWRGMLNPEVGVINRNLVDLFGVSPAWFADPWLAKFAVIIVNLWLGYPYFMLITGGALQAIPEDIYQAAEVDGANAWQRFRQITLPLLLVSVGPLLLASFIYNFNNFNLIYLFLQGGPPIAGASTRAGHTDILISYVYQLAFAGGRGQNFGLASAITIVIFLVVAVMTLFQFRYTAMWEEVSENV